MPLPVASAFLTAALAAWVMTRALIPLTLRSGLVDVPNARSSHKQATPRGGGLGIVVGASAGLTMLHLLGAPLPGVPLLLGASLIAISGFLDDRNGGLPVAIRLAVHVAAAAVVVLAAGGLPTLPFPPPLNLLSGSLAVPIGILWVVGVTNLYNFLDGIDGFAALQGVVAGCGLAFFAQGTAVGYLGIVLAGACIGFLIFNWHPARIFMGDVGSTTVGFVLAAAPFELDAQLRPGLIFALAILLWFFLSDGVFTLARRVLKGDRVWEAHRSHLYQRLVLTGLPHDVVTLIVQGATILLALLMALAMQAESPAVEWLVLGIALAAFVGYAILTLRREKEVVARPGT